MQSATPFRSTAIKRSQYSSSNSATGLLSGLRAALFTPTSSRPNSATVRRTISGTCADSETSALTKIALPPEAVMPSVTARPRSSSMSTNVTAPPASAKSVAVASPMPMAAPVTMATFPSSTAGVVVMCSSSRLVGRLHRDATV